MAAVLALVTGVAGFIGSQLAEHIRSAGWQVRGVDSFTPYYDRELKESNLSALRSAADVELVEADLPSAPLEPLLDDVDVVFHFAAQPGVRASWDEFTTYSDHNLVVTHRLLQASRRRRLQRFVFASSSSVYGQSAEPVAEDAPTRPFNPYGVTKLAAESLCRAYAENFGVPTVSLRLFTVYGPRQRPDMAFDRLIRAALGGEPFTVYGDGSQARAFTYVGDAVDAAWRAADADVRPGSVFNISGGVSSSCSEVIEIVERAVGNRSTVVHRRRATRRCRADRGDRRTGGHANWAGRPAPTRRRASPVRSPTSAATSSASSAST